jgi:hypothetical protein
MVYSNSNFAISGKENDVYELLNGMSFRQTKSLTPTNEGLM